MSVIYFKENQQFREIPLFIILGLLQILFAWGLVQQVIAGKPWGSKPAPDSVIIGINIGAFILLLILFFINLKTVITNEHICFRLFPLHLKKKTFLWSDVLHVQIIKYDGIREFWGYGIKYVSGKGWSYALSGEYGLRLTIRGGEKFFIGTHRPWELAKAVESLQKIGIVKILK